MRHQNPEKSNNFFKQNVFNEKLNNNSFYMALGGSLPVEHNYSICLLFDLNDNLYSRTEARTL